VPSSDPGAPETAPRRRSRAAVWLRIGGIAVAVLAVALCVKTLSDQWSSIRSSIAHANLAWIAVALVCSAAGMTFLGLLWWRCLHVFGSPNRKRDAVAWYFGGELGKYLPGGIWPVLGRGELAQRGGVSRGDAYATTLISYAVMCIAAAITCGVLAPVVAADGHGLGWGWALLLLIPVGLAAVHPAVLGRILRLGKRVTRGRVDLTPPRWTTMLELVAIAVPTWVLVGTASAAVTEALGYHQQPARVMFAAVAAWILGFLAVPVPAGAGVRELVFVGLSGLAHAPAVAVAAIARLLLIVVDAVGGILGLWFSRRSTPQPLPDLTRTGDR
jgi:glycosyltransferase 2 family protein